MTRPLFPLLAVTLTLTACTTPDAATQPPPRTTTAPTPAASPTPSPTPVPTPPATADGISVTSADAFARFYMTAIDHAAATGDGTALTRWADKGCVACRELSDHYAKVYAAGGSLSGDFRSRNLKATSVRLNGTKAADVTVRFTDGRHSITPSRGARPTPYEGGEGEWRMALFNQSGHWVMYEMQEKK